MPRTRLMLLAAAAILASTAAPSTQTPRPNIVLIVADDMGYADIGVHGAKDIPTPNIDAIFASGIRFTDAYVTGPYCSPTRAGLLTGKYPQRFGHEFNLGLGPTTNELGLPLSEATLADRLKAAGYRTALFGKWHLGRGEKYHPQSRGFDEFFGFLGGAHSYMEIGADGGNPVLDGRKRAASMPYLTDALADRAADFVKRHQTQPFFLYLAFNAVHTPMQAPEKYLARFPHIKDDMRRTYAAMLSAMDDGIGRTMQALRASGIENRTLVIFMNDNGGPTMQGTTINGSSNAPLRGSKRQTYEGGIRIPFAMQWKGRLTAGQIDRRPVIQLDVLPTALAVAGVTVDNTWRLDGVNLMPYLTGQNNGRPHDALYWRLGQHIAIRQGDWKLVRTSEGPLQQGTPESLETLAKAELYNLTTDIGERTNVAASEPQRARELAEAWLRWEKELAKPLWGPGRGGS